MKFMLITNEPNVAKEAVAAGVDRIFIDFEVLNKAERQRGMNTVLSKHTFSDLEKICDLNLPSEILVRINPIGPHSESEIEKVLEFNPDVLMLPMVYDADDVSKLVSYVRGRAKICIMIETVESFARIDQILNVSGIDEIFIGLNDLHLGFGLRFMFEPLSLGLVDYLSEKIKCKNIPFGFGGIAKLGEGAVEASNILSEHIRLGSSSVILSRTFKGTSDSRDSGSNKVNLSAEVDKLRKKNREIESYSNSQLMINRCNLIESVCKVVEK